MNKATLIKRISAASGQTELVVRSVIDSTSDVMIKALVAGEAPYGIGLGKFTAVKRPPKKARDIRRGTDVVVPERIAILFKPSKPLSDAVNGKRGL